MIQCSTCKQELEPDVRFCPHDGTPLTETAPAPPTLTPPERATTGQMPASKELELPLVIGGRYRLSELRGGGGMAKVYRAIDVTLEREVAVKLIIADLRHESEFDTRFQREARIASQLNDPHIVVVHDFGIDAAHGPFLVMEYLQGQSLRERLQSEGSLPFRAGLQLGAQLLLALIHAHGKDIVHRDIKPDNIFLLNQSGVRLHIRVLDFGIARLFRRGESGRAETLTRPGAVLGTPRYMSPEQLAGQPVDARSDLYSAALVIHEALTGQLPYVSGKKLGELCPEASPSLQDLLDQCLKPNPAERPASAVEVYLRLQELGKASGIVLLPSTDMAKLAASARASQPTIAYAPPRWWTRRRLGLALISLLFLLGLAGKLWFKHSPWDGQHESLAGVQIGDPRQEVVDRLKLTKGGPMNPWATNQPPGYLGNLLRAEDLHLPEDGLNHLDVQRSGDDRICVIFFEDRVRAVIAQRGQTGRGVKTQSWASEVISRYAEDATEETRVLVNQATQVVEKKIQIRRYDTLGIGFEIHQNKVFAVALYPAVSNP